MFLEFHDLLVRGEKQELFMRCFNRCYAAVSVSYEYERAKLGSFWILDERYHDHGIAMLYERFSYAMGMVANRFYRECAELYDLNEAYKKSLSFSVCLSGCVDEVFKRSIRDLGFDDATMAYYQADYLDDEYQEFWELHKRLAAKVKAVRESFSHEDRTFLHGFNASELENSDEEELETDNRDCLHMMRICKQSEVNFEEVDKFLIATKREYLPMMIRLFIARPKEDIFANKPPAKWWKIWKR